jgi:nucleoside diphosphate kinase
VGVTDSVSADTPLEAAPIPATEESQTVNAGNDTEVEVAESNDVGLDDAEQVEIDSVLAEAEAEAAKTNTPLVKHLRKVVETQKAELKKLASNSLTDIDREAVELYQGLTSFDNERGVPSAKKFAESLAQKDPNLAYQAAVDLLSLQAPGEIDGFSFGHAYLKANGIDPTRLDDIRSFLEGNQKTTFEQVPEYVPKEYQDAYKQLSEKAREYLDFQLEGDEFERNAGLEVLQNKQYRIDEQNAKEQYQSQAQAKLAQEIESEVITDTLQTFNSFVENFYETPTFKDVQVSGNQLVDSAIKKSVNQMVVNLAEPDTVAGKQALSLFQELGVSVDSQKIAELIGIVNGSIETSIKAGKGNHLPSKAAADNAKLQALQRLSGLRNSLWSQAVSKIAQGQKESSESHDVLNNAGLPSFGNSQTIGGEKKMSTLDWINARKLAS